VVAKMRNILSLDIIYNDFISKVTLSSTEIEILDRYLKNESIIKISLEVSSSYSSVSRTISKLKNKYDNYRRMELAKLTLLKEKN
jgi:hypothetical protein